MTTFLRLLSESDKELALRDGCASLRAGASDKRLYQIDPDVFGQVPGSPFAYWISPSVRSLFNDCERFGSDGRNAQHGCSTKDDTRFVRLSWEIQSPEDKWFPYAKGGSFSPFYQDIAFLINWKNDAVELEASLLKKFPYLGDNANWVLHRESSYFKAGLKWPLRASAFAPQAMPQGVVFSGRSYAAFSEDADLPWLLALLNSTAFDYLFKILLGRFGYPEFLVGTVQLVPFPTIAAEYKEELHALGLRAWSLKRSLDAIEECSHAFVLPAALMTRLRKFDSSEVESELSAIHSEIDDLAFKMYGFSNDDRVAIFQTLEAEGGVFSEDEAENDAENDGEEVAPPVDMSIGLLSWAIGVAFARFDWRLSNGERQAPSEPDPFDPLPLKSPGMLPDGYAPFHANVGILVDDSGHPHDLARLVEEVLVRVDVVVPGNVRRWLQRDFFAFHLQRYSKSRRKAPIYWPLSTASGSYTLWIYYPSLNNQTLFTAVNDFLDGPNGKLTQVIRECAELRMKGNVRSRDEEKRYETLQTFEQELTDLRDTLLKIAPSYQPNQDDGVQITAAPLWPLFRHKAWQKLLADTWAKLEKGNSDWAHLAMAYWPERVREKCKTDKSLAIAHGLEELYVEPDAASKKTREKKKAGANE